MANRKQKKADSLRKSKVEKRLREIAALCDTGYDMMMGAADKWVNWDDYTIQMGDESWRDRFPAYAKEFWRLYNEFHGAHVPESKHENFFSCSC